MIPGNIVIAGGYGQVGREIAALLAPRHPGRVMVAGRNAAKAAEAARGAGHGARGTELDVARGRAPEGASLVIMCLDWQDPSFAADCLSHGVGYVDVTADSRVIEMMEGLDRTAARHEATGLLGVGLAPGLTNLLAAEAVSRPPGDGTDRPTAAALDLFVLLGAGDKHGAAAIEWTLDRLDSEFDVIEVGRPRRVRAQRETREVNLPGRKRPVRGARFDFPEQRTLVRTLGLPTVSSWMVTLPPAAARSLRMATARGLGELTRRPRSRRAIVRLLESGGAGSDACGAITVATWPDGTGTRASVLGRDQSRLTALATTLMVEQVIEGRVAPGVHQSDQVIDRARVFRELAEAEPTLDLDLP